MSDWQERAEVLNHVEAIHRVALERIRDRAKRIMDGTVAPTAFASAKYAHDVALDALVLASLLQDKHGGTDD